MIELEPASKRTGFTWRLAVLGTLGMSLLVNLVLAVKIAVFDPNYPFRPLCHGGRHFGLLVLDQPMNRRFKDEMLRSIWNTRILNDKVLYISYWKWTNKKETLWNLSREAAEILYIKKTGVSRITNKKREILQTGRCKFIRKYALKNPKANWKKIPAE